MLSHPLPRLRRAGLLLLAAGAATAQLHAQTAPTLGPAPRVVTRRPAFTQPNGALPAAYGDASYGLVVDPSRRELARVLFRTVYAASTDATSGWTGSVAGNVPGTTTGAFKDATALRINYFRAMAGIPAAITFTGAHNAKDQQAALMMSANQTLDHHPPASWLDYTADGADAAANSNLALGTSGPGAVDGFIQDDGSNNAEVGHRRWLLFPPTVVMGTGDVDYTPGQNGVGTYYPANAIWVTDLAGSTGYPATRENFVAWPAAGFVPYALVFDRWSLSYPGADFGAAGVAMTSGGTTYTCALEPVAEGFGDNTLAWRPQGLDLSAFGSAAGVPVAQEKPIHVVVSGVKIGGQTRSFAYDVTPFDPARPGPDTAYPTLSGPAQPVAGAPNAYTVAAVPGATGYQWEADTLSPLTLVADAESGPGDLVLNPPGSQVITTATAASGAASYQLTSYPSLAMMLGTTFVPAAGTTLQFSSRLAYATTDETAQVQVSKDLGQSWQTLYTQTGTNTPGESIFTPHTVDLSAYAGQSCRVRFVYFTAGSYFAPADNVGWFLDDISVTGAQKLTLGAPTPVTAGRAGFDFTPPAAGNYALRVRPVFFGSYFAADLDSVQYVTATGTGTAHPSFFTGESALGGGAYYLSFASGNPFGYYSYLADPHYVYHFDLGYEYVFDAGDGSSGVYFYDFASNGFFYTSPSFPFPYLYDFSLGSTVYYYPDPNSPGRYNTDGTRYFYVFSTGQIIAK